MKLAQIISTCLAQVVFSEDLPILPLNEEGDYEKYSHSDDDLDFNIWEYQEVVKSRDEEGSPVEKVELGHWFRVATYSPETTRFFNDGEWFSNYLQIEDPNVPGLFDSVTCNVEWDMSSQHTAKIRNYKGYQSLRNADDNNSNRKWNQIATDDEITDQTGLWSLVGAYTNGWDSQYMSEKEPDRWNPDEEWRRWNQDCYVTRTMYETVNGIAPNELTAQRNQEYLYNVEEEVEFTVYSGYRIYKQRGKDKAKKGDDRSPFQFKLKKFALTRPPPEEDTNQQREEETVDHDSNEEENQEFGQEDHRTGEENQEGQEERDADED